MDDPPAVKKARAQFEADRAKAEVWYSKAVNTAKTSEDRNATLLRYVLRVYYSLACKVINLGIELKEPVNEIRKKVENAIPGVAEEAFRSKHYHGNDRLRRNAFCRWANEAIRDSPDWTKIQRKLREIAEWQAENVIGSAQPETLSQAGGFSGQAPAPTHTQESSVTRELVTSSKLEKYKPGLREKRLQRFVTTHPTTIAAVRRTAKVAKAQMQQWRHDELSNDSVMSQRIENVLSGKTPLVPLGKKKG